MRSTLICLLPMLALPLGCGGGDTTGTEAPESVEAPARAVSNQARPATVEGAPAGELTVLFTNNVDGEIEPCG